MRLSICMMVKNESKHLEKCLKSLQPIRDEVNSELIIVDTGSEDNTVEIAKKFTDKVYFHKWNNNFSEMRNITISYAKGEWVFIIDGDEVLQNPEEIKKFLNSKESKNYNSGTITIKNFTQKDDKTSYTIFSALRLFRRDNDFRFIGAVHNQPVYKKPIISLNAIAFHYGYLADDSELMEKKFKRTSTILKKELEKNPENIYYWFQLSRSYGMHKDFKESLECAVKAYELIKQKKLDPKKYMYVYSALSWAYLVNKKFKQVEEVCKEALDIKGEYIDFYFYIAKAQVALGKYVDAIKYYEKYLDLVKKFNNLKIKKDITISHYTIGKFEEAYNDLSILYKIYGNYKKSFEFIGKINNPTIILKNLPKNIDVYFNLKKYDELKQIYETKLLNQEKRVVYEFWESMEKKTHNLSGIEKEKVVKLFSQDTDQYSILNRTRLQIMKNNYKYNSELLTLIKTLDFEKLPYFYGDIIYYLLKTKQDLLDYLINVRDTSMSHFLGYLAGKYSDFSSTVLNYLNEHELSLQLNECKLNKVLLKQVLIDNKISEDEYKSLFKRYINEGIHYIKQIYNNKVIMNEMLDYTRNDEDAFLVYIHAAQENKNVDKVLYIRYLRKALKIYPKMKRGIEILLNEFKSNNYEIDNNGFIENKQKVKQKIEEFLYKGDLKRASEIISQYENIKNEDIDIYSMKAIIAMMENKLDNAENIIEEGLKLESNNCDLLYNKAYLLKLKGNKQEANELYRRILELTDDEELKKEVQNELLNYEDKEKHHMNSVEEENTPLSDNIKEEFENHKKKLKDNINKLIEQQKLTEAKLLINEYEKIVPKDLEIIMYKSRIALLETELSISNK